MAGNELSLRETAALVGMGHRWWRRSWRRWVAEGFPAPLRAPSATEAGLAGYAWDAEAVMAWIIDAGRAGELAPLSNLRPRALDKGADAARSRDKARAAWLLAVDLASEAGGVDVRATVKTRGTPGRGGDAQTSQARKIACYLAVTVGGCRAAEVAAAAGMDPTTVRASVAWVDDAMDTHPTLANELDQLEARLIRRAADICIGRLAYLDGEGA